MTRTILIDGDILAYQIGFSVESNVYVCANRIFKTKGKAELRSKLTGKEIHERRNRGSFEQCKLNLKMKLKSIFDDLGTSNYKMYLTGKDNFRNDLNTLLIYKGNRKAPKPWHFNRIREHLINDYNAILVNGQEADDAIGIEQYRVFKETGSFEHTYIATIDKDLKILEGWHYHLNYRMLSFVESEEGLKRFYGQLLTGDGVDNIPGLSKQLKIKGWWCYYYCLLFDQIGLFMASVFLLGANKLSHSKPGYITAYNEFASTHTAQECLNYVLTLYNEYGINKEDVETTGRLLWIRREEDEMWQLPKELN